MVNGGVQPFAGPFDFGRKRPDPQIQLLDRERVEILLAEQGERIARLAREEFVDVHVLKVDRIAAYVNKSSNVSRNKIGDIWLIYPNG